MAVLKYLSPVDGQYYPVSYQVPVVAGMNDLTDADTTTIAPAVGDSLVWDGTNWVPGDRVMVAGDTRLTMRR